MNDIRIEATPKTPYVNLNAFSGDFMFSGKSIPFDAESFYAPILNWLDLYKMTPASMTKVEIDLDFFNISSSKRLLFIMYKLNEIAQNGHNVLLKWHYYKDDDDMYEVGQDYAFMIQVPFEFVSKEREMIPIV